MAHQTLGENDDTYPFTFWTNLSTKEQGLHIFKGSTWVTDNFVCGKLN